jgi:hypothetical protein
MHARALALAALLVPSAGCPDRTIAEVPVDQDKIEQLDIPAVPRGFDILFVIDNSGSMVDEQASLIANFPRMIEVLETLEGGLPDVHIGVITPNMGASAIDGTRAAPVGPCSGEGDGGILRALDGNGPRFLRDVDDGAGGRTRNYSGTLADAFSRLAQVGSDGCGIEQHLEAVKRATDGGQPLNAGFLRPDAYLAVIVIADEDDCSLAKSTLFDSLPRADPNWGEITNFRCTSQGVECETPATDFLAAPGPREDCHPRIEPGEVADIGRYISHLKGLKADPRDVAFAAIVGEPGSFEIVQTGGVTVLGNACTNPNANAKPAVRTDHVLQQFELSTRATICEGDLSRALGQIGELLVERIDPCFDSDLADVDPVAPGPQYECSVTEVSRIGGVETELRVLPSCELGAAPCWRIEEDAVQCSYTAADPHFKLVIEREGGVDPNLHLKAACVTASSSGPVL